MSESVAVVKRVIDATNRADFDAVIEAFSDDLEFDFSNSHGPLSGVYRGRGGAQEFLNAFFEPFASVEFDPHEILELDDGRVMAVTTVRVRGTGSGVDVAAKGATIWTVRDGEIAAVKMYQSKGDALEDASAES